MGRRPGGGISPGARPVLYGAPRGCGPAALIRGSVADTCSTCTDAENGAGPRKGRGQGINASASLAIWELNNSLRVLKGLDGGPPGPRIGPLFIAVTGRTWPTLTSASGHKSPACPATPVWANAAEAGRFHGSGWTLTAAFHWVYTVLFFPLWQPREPLEHQTGLCSDTYMFQDVGKTNHTMTSVDS